MKQPSTRESHILLHGWDGHSLLEHMQFRSLNEHSVSGPMLYSHTALGPSVTWGLIGQPAPCPPPMTIVQSLRSKKWFILWSTEDWSDPHPLPARMGEETAAAGCSAGLRLLLEPAGDLGFWSKDGALARGDEEKASRPTTRPGVLS